MTEKSIWLNGETHLKLKQIVVNNYPNLTLKQFVDQVLRERIQAESAQSQAIAG